MPSLGRFAVNPSCRFDSHRPYQICPFKRRRAPRSALGRPLFTDQRKDAPNYEALTARPEEDASSGSARLS